MTVPDERTDTYTGTRIAAATPFKVECRPPSRQMTCDDQ